MILVSASSLVAIGSIRKTAGLRRLRELLAEMDIRDMLMEDWISWSGHTVAVLWSQQDMNMRSMIGWRTKCAKEVGWKHAWRKDTGG